MTTPIPSQPPLSAGAVPELPVVAWRADDHSSPHVALTREGLGLVGNRYGYALTPHAPAQATIHAQAAEIERLKRERDHSPRYGPLWRELRAEIESLKAKQVAEVDEVMRLADAMAQTSGAFGCTLAQHDLVASIAAREALRAALTKDRT